MNADPTGVSSDMTDPDRLDADPTTDAAAPVASMVAPDNPAEAAPPVDDSDELVTLVQEIKQRLSEVEEREAELERREVELSERVQQSLTVLDEQRITSDDSESPSEPPRVSVESDSAELRRRRRGELARRVQSARDAIARQRATDVERPTETSDEFSQIAAALRAREEELEQRAASFAERESAIQQAESDVARRNAELARESGELASRVAQTQQRDAELAALRAAVEQRSAEIDALRETVNRQAAETAAQAAALAQRSADLEARRESLQHRAVEIESHSADISQRGQHAAARQTALDRRSGELESQALSLAQRAAELDGRKTTIDQQIAETTARMAEIEARSAALDVRMAELSSRETALVAGAATTIEPDPAVAERRAAVDKLYAQASEIEERARARFEQAGTLKQQLVEKAGELKEFRRRLEAAQREILTERARLKTDRETHVLLDAELTRRREAFEIESLDLGRRTDQLAEREAEAERTNAERAAQFEEQRSALRAETRRISDQIKDRAAQIEQRRTKLRQHAAQLTKQRDELVEQSRRLQTRSADLDKHIAELESRRRQAETRAGEIARLDQESQRRRAELDQRESGIAAREIELRDLDASARQRESAIEERRTAAERLYSQAADQDQRARARFEEAGNLQTELQSKEAELASATLAAEIGREEVETERARLLVERDTLNFLHAEAQRVIKDGRAPGAAPGAAAVEPAIARRGRPSMWPLRSLALSAATAAAAGFAVLQFDKPAFQTTMTLAIDSQRVADQEAVAEHLREWMADGSAATTPVDATLAAIWNAALHDGRVDVGPSRSEPGLTISIRTSDEAQAATLLKSAAGRFVEQVGALPPERFFSPRMFEWKQRRATLDAERSAAVAAVADVESRLAAAQGFDEWNRARGEVERTQAEFDRIARRLGEQRGQLTALRSVDSPRVELPPAEVAAALAMDALYLEDLNEIAAVAREYRLSLALAMMMTVEPLRDVRSTFQSLHKTIEEQRNLQPPESAAIVLEEAAARLEAFDRRLAEAAQKLDESRKDVERMNPAESVPELVRHQTETAAAARETLIEMRSTMDWLAGRINSLSSRGDVGTREMVIASLLRGNLSGLGEKIEVFSQAAAESDLATNFKLETADRQLRSLRTRSADRRDTIRADLEQAALAGAQRSHDDQLRELDEEVRELERRRDELTTAMGAMVGELRGLEEKMHEVRGLHAELRARQDAQRRIDDRIVALDAEKPDIPADTITPSAIHSQQIAGADRARRAWSAAGIAGGVTLLVCVLMIAGPTRPRRG